MKTYLDLEDAEPDADDIDEYGRGGKIGWLVQLDSTWHLPKHALALCFSAFGDVRTLGDFGVVQRHVQSKIGDHFSLFTVSSFWLIEIVKKSPKYFSCFPDATPGSSAVTPSLLYLRAFLVLNPAPT